VWYSLWCSGRPREHSGRTAGHLAGARRLAENNKRVYIGQWETGAWASHSTRISLHSDWKTRTFPTTGIYLLFLMHYYRYNMLHFSRQHYLRLCLLGFDGFSICDPSTQLIPRLPTPATISHTINFKTSTCWSQLITILSIYVTKPPQSASYLVIATRFFKQIKPLYRIHWLELQNNASGKGLAHCSYNIFDYWFRDAIRECWRLVEIILHTRELLWRNIDWPAKV